MILQGSKLINTPVMSLQTGSEIASTTKPLVDPADLSIVAYEVGGQLLDKKPMYLRLADVRELSDIGMIVDSSDELISPEDVIEINDLHQLHFDIMGMPVTDEKKHKLGKVIDYTIDTNTFEVQQLTVKRPFLKSLNDTELLIHREQIIEINNSSIVIHSETERPEIVEQPKLPAAYVNPFRKTNPAAPEATERN